MRISQAAGDHTVPEGGPRLRAVRVRAPQRGAHRPLPGAGCAEPHHRHVLRAQHLDHPAEARHPARPDRALGRRARAADGELLVVGGIRLDVDRRRVHAGDDEVPLTATEFALLTHLMRAPGRVFSREQLLSAVWGYPAGAGTRTVDVHIAQLRAKLGRASPIRTVRGVGYAADAP